MSSHSRRTAVVIVLAVPILSLVGYVVIRQVIEARIPPSVSFEHASSLMSVDATTCGLQTEELTISWDRMGSNESRVAVIEILSNYGNSILHSFHEDIGSDREGTLNLNYTFYSVELLNNTEYTVRISIAAKDTYNASASTFSSLATSTSTVKVLKPRKAYPTTPQPSEAELGTIHAYEHCGNSKSIVISLDDGPATELAASRKILDFMKEYHPDVKLTFFVSPIAYGESSMADRCDLVSRMIEDGHHVESHSWTHSNFTQAFLNNIPGMIDELDHVRTWIQCCSPIPDYPVTVFRPPYGELAVPLARVATELGYSLSFWNHDLYDYLYFDRADPVGDNAKLQQMLSVLNSFLPSADSDKDVVILAHDRNVYQVRAIVEVVSMLKTKLPNHKFVSAKECWESCLAAYGGAFCNDPYELPITEQYIKFLNE